MAIGIVAKTAKALKIGEKIVKYPAVVAVCYGEGEADFASFRADSAYQALTTDYNRGF